MARKGVLASNPDIQNMTYAQWLWEYEALREKEKETVETALEFLKLLRVTFIKLLGLDLLVDKKEGDETPIESLFVPMTLMAGRREVADLILKKMDEEAVIKKTEEDETFEKLSAAIARGEDLGDMEPMINDVQHDTIKELLRTEELTAIGVKIIDGPLKNTSHITLNNSGAVQKSKQIIDELNAARRSVAQQLKEEIIKPRMIIKLDEEDKDA